MTEPEHAANLEVGLREQFGDREGVSLTVSDEGHCRLAFPDRTLVVERRHEPAKAPAWTLVLRADGETVSKFGPLETTTAVLERIAALVDADVRYTVCCDGSPS
ncbi:MULTISPECIES: hypothetical protein [Halomicrobium]|uniref:Uncharacterized protein n=2 Tax=Halomicrobium mukohataei TaxID=57705 RepID=C7P388_HALMD|nr:MULTISPECIES: hypothetical protein [Halomicrobium]ACV47560.1 conserved hypothetical protein [Halomicrobium mukohataei DSM 12286]QCD66023.1 hypothetical protein E5139_10355 [Halomicrobium mukohataei]QFR20828.1 hypothetical protein GBQ70_10350 [Halomicrobium sp. ZPS1]